jgi:hypothetical protein
MPIALSAGHRFPDIAVPRLGGGEIELGVPGPGRDWQMIIVYRGKHCPICGVRPCRWTGSGGVFDRGAGVAVLELGGAEIAQGGM